MEKRLDFFVVGTQKGGTTALDRLLRRHPEIEMPRTRKELHFFDDDTIDWRAPDYERLHRQFDWRAGAIRGEITPIYSYWPGSVERISEYNPKASIVMLLRHPVWRAASQWRMECSRGNDEVSFAEAIGESGRARVQKAPNGVHRVFSYVERGFYSAQIAKLLRFFPRERVSFFRTDHLWLDPQSSMARIEIVLGVSHRLQPEREYIVPHVNAEEREIDSRAFDGLRRVYEADIRITAALTGLDLSDWLDASYTEPMAG